MVTILICKSSHKIECLTSEGRHVIRIEAGVAEPWHQTKSRPQPRVDSHEYLNNNIQTLVSVIQGNLTLALEAMATVRFRYKWRLQLRPATTLSILNR